MASAHDDSLMTALLDAARPRIVQPPSGIVEVHAQEPDAPAIVMPPDSLVLAAIFQPSDDGQLKLPPVRMKHWGETMNMLERPEATPVREESSASWGQTTRALTLGSQKYCVARVYLEKSESLNLSIDVVQPPPFGSLGGATVPIYVWALIEFGNGSAQVQRQVRCDYRIDLTLSVTYLEVFVYLGDSAGNVLASSAAANYTGKAVVSGFVGRGSRALPYVTSIFTQGSGSTSAAAGAALINAPARLLSITAHLIATAGSDRYLQLFDQTTAPLANTVPTAEFALGTSPAASSIGAPANGQTLNPRGFAQGIFYAVSSTGGKYTAAGDSAWVEFQTLLL